MLFYKKYGLKIHINRFTINGYNCFPKWNNNYRSGGVIIYVTQM